MGIASARASAAAAMSGVLASSTTMLNLVDGFNSWLAAGLPAESGLPTGVVNSVPAPMFMDLLDAGMADASVVLIDVRDEGAYDAGHIEGAVRIPLALFTNASTLPGVLDMLPSNMTLMLYCNVGAASMAAANAIVDSGLRPDGIVVELDGGIGSWTSMPGYELVMTHAMPGELASVDPAEFRAIYEFESQYEDRVVLIDVRPMANFDELHIDGAVSIPLSMWTNGTMLPQTLALIPPGATMMFYCTMGAASRAAANTVVDSGLVPNTTAIYHLEDGFNSWLAAGYPGVPTLLGSQVNELSPLSFYYLHKAAMMDASVYVVDVRPYSMFAAGHIDGAVNVPVILFDNPDAVNATIASLPTDKILAFYCTMGAASRRAATAVVGSGLMPASLVANLEDGLSSWVAAGYPLAMVHSPGVQGVPADRFKTILDFEQTYDNVLLIDVRPLEQYITGFIAGALAIPVAAFDNEATRDQTVRNLPDDKVIMFYCSSGAAAMRAATLSADTGILPADTVYYYLEGGVSAWVAEGYMLAMLEPAK